MGLLETMDNELDCIEVIFQSYITSKNKNEIFLFFEGKDDFKYYCSRVSSIIGEKDFKKYHCNSKINVLKLYSMIKEKSTKEEKNRLLYFIDHDYDGAQIPDDIYMTSSYSIENYYFTDKAIRNLLMGVIGFSEENQDDNKDLETTFTFLKNKRDEVIEEIIYSNAWYSLQIKKSKDQSCFPNLNKLKDYNAVKNIKNIKELEELATNPIQVTENEVDIEIKSLREDSVSKIRGKYFVQALTPVLKKVFQDAGRKENREFFIKKRKIRFSLSDVLCELASYAYTPPELTSYILKMLSP